MGRGRLDEVPGGIDVSSFGAGTVDNRLNAGDCLRHTSSRGRVADHVVDALDASPLFAAEHAHVTAALPKTRTTWTPSVPVPPVMSIGPWPYRAAPCADSLRASATCLVATLSRLKTLVTAIIRSSAASPCSS